MVSFLPRVTIFIFCNVTRTISVRLMDPVQETAQVPVNKPVVSKTYISIDQLFDNNKHWAEKHTARNPNFFKDLAQQQKPEILWIGCSDSRVPSTQILQLKPGQVFTHRNIANVITHTDLNCLSVLSYAVEVLRVKHIIVCGHYGCGGVAAAEGNKQYGLIDNWLRHIKDVYNNNREALEERPPGKDRTDLLVELNVARSVANVCYTTIVQNAWAKGQELDIQGWTYSIEDGLIRSLGLNISGTDQLDDIFVFENILNQTVVESHDLRSSTLSIASTTSPDERNQLIEKLDHINHDTDEASPLWQLTHNTDKLRRSSLVGGKRATTEC
eukprot:TRINITY_DN151_c0_g2_i1.p1 TRINITY_DN151_c0_g2~~TRINITY_DN151_c0_g2_i1.p1  ORF type:complete len:328 (+),score=67.94 TRINITY_DN151_c0_g2_i1:276-1259(+)